MDTQSGMHHQQGVPALTRREREVLRLASKGLSGREIAAHLCRSPRTVENHLRSIYRKFGVRNRVEMIRAAQSFGLLSSLGDPIEPRNIPQQVADGPSSTQPMSEIELKSRSWQIIRQLDAALARQSNHGYFGKLVLTLSTAFGVRWGGITEISNEQGILDIIAFAADGKLAGYLGCPKHGSPCGYVLDHGVCVITDKLKEQYPNDPALDTIDARSYVGVKLEDRLLGPVGTLWIMDDKPIDANEHPEKILQLFARRTAAELALAKTLDRLDEVSFGSEKKN